MNSNNALPKDIATTKITIYNYFKKSDGKETYKRTVLDDVYYRDTSIDVFKQTGNEVDETVIIKVNYYEENYVPKNEWLKQTDITNKFTFDNSINGRSTLIVKGECPFTFGDLEPADFSNKVTEFEEAYKNHRKVNDIKDAFWGSKSMWHSTIKC